MMNTPGLIALTSLMLSACGSMTQPVMKTGDLIDHLESQGYSKIIICQPLDCGRAGKGRIFIATKANKPVTGQICYLKGNDSVTYKVDERKVTN
jgi:hypothetical protein